MRTALERLSIKTRKSAAVHEPMSRATARFSNQEISVLQQQLRCCSFVFRTPDTDRSELEVIAGK
jgi:hypothetical protein